MLSVGGARVALPGLQHHTLPPSKKETYPPLPSMMKMKSKHDAAHFPTAQPNGDCEKLLDKVCTLAPQKLKAENICLEPYEYSSPVV